MWVVFPHPCLHNFHTWFHKSSIPTSNYGVDPTSLSRCNNYSHVSLGGAPKSWCNTSFFIMYVFYWLDLLFTPQYVLYFDAPLSHWCYIFGVIASHCMLNMMMWCSSFTDNIYVDIHLFMVLMLIHFGPRTLFLSHVSLMQFYEFNSKFSANYGGVSHSDYTFRSCDRMVHPNGNYRLCNFWRNFLIYNQYTSCWFLGIFQNF